MDQDLDNFLNNNEKPQTDSEHGEIVEMNNMQNIDTEESRTLRIKIRKYKKTFGQELTDFNFDDLEMLSVDELKKKYDDLRVCLNSGSNSLITSAYHMSVGLLETVSTATGYIDLTGLSANCSNNPAIQRSLQMLEIEYGKYTTLSNPAEQLIYSTLLTCLITHNMNKNKIVQEKVKNDDNIVSL